jgi:hypothetical protein
MLMQFLLGLGIFVLGYLANDAVRWLRAQADERRRMSDRWRR